MAAGVSVIIPTHGRPRYLAESIQSALLAGGDDVEVIVVDDASPSPVRLPPSEGRVRAVRLDSNSGPSVARNVGVQHASSKICAFLDDDDLMTPGRLVRGIEFVVPGTATMCRLGRASGGGKPRPIARPLFHGDMSRSLLENRPPCLGQIMFHVDDFVPFDPLLRSAEDSEWWIRMSTRIRFVDVPAIGYLIRDHVGERLGRNAQVMLQNREYVLRQHADYFAQRPRARAAQLQRISAAALVAKDFRRARSAAIGSLRYPSKHRLKLLALSSQLPRLRWSSNGS